MRVVGLTVMLASPYSVLRKNHVATAIIKPIFQMKKLRLRKIHSFLTNISRLLGISSLFQALEIRSEKRKKQTETLLSWSTWSG